MLKLIAACFIALSFSSLHAQSDFLVLKKRHTSLHTYMPGSYISVMMVNDVWVSGYIRNIQHDSIYIKTFRLQPFLDAWGLVATDTIYMSVEKVAMKNIKAMPKEKEGFAYVRNGAILEIGAGGYMLLNIINTLGDKDPVFGEKNAPRLGTAAGVFGLGLLLSLLHSDYTLLGKKYHLDYIQLNSPAK